MWSGLWCGYLHGIMWSVEKNLKVHGDVVFLSSVVRCFCQFVVSEVTWLPVGSEWGSRLRQH